MRTWVHCGLVGMLLLGAGQAPGQNLVPNGSFEDYTTCPPYFGYSFLAEGWGGPGGIGFQSPDYFNACDTTGVIDVPSSSFGYQEAFHGQAYMGMLTTLDGSAPWYREIIGAELLEPLQTGVPVCISFRMAVGGFGTSQGNSVYNTSKNLGIKFFANPPTNWMAYLYPNSAALHMDVVPTDTTVWYFVAGTYVPDSAYEYVVLGNFFADSLSGITLLDSTGWGIEGSYGFMDDVRVSFDLNYCDADLSIADERDHAITVFPNPCGDRLVVLLPSSLSGEVTYRVFDTQGRLLVIETVQPNHGVLNISTVGLKAGPYVLCVSERNGESFPVPFVRVSP